jgi:glycosyltransferase involved in cell wall biosynthesis
MKSTHRPEGLIRVVYLTPTLNLGGAERQMIILAGALPSDVFEVRFVLLSERGPLAEQAEAAGASVHVLGLSQQHYAPSRPQCVRAAIRALHRYRALTADVDIVDAWLAPAMTFAMLAQPLVRVPTLLGGRRWLGDLYESKPWYRRAATVAAARRMDAIVTNSRVAARELIVQDGVAPGRVHVIPNAVLPSVSSPADRQRYRANWGFSADDLVVGSVANYKAEKRLGMLIDAAARLREQVPELRVVMVGEGPLRGELEADIRRRQLEPIVRLHGAEPDARLVYSAFDLYVQASQSEGLPNVILEAAAAGLPIVATAVGGTTEIVTGEQNALLVERGDVAALASAIGRLATDPELRERLGRAARNRAADFSTERLVDATASLYLRLAGRSPGEDAVWRQRS